MQDSLIYNTRDEKGVDITKIVKIKKYQLETKDFVCMCGKKCNDGIPVKKIVSSNFTEWQYVSDYICENCSYLFSLYFYSYIVDSEKIRLLNIREMSQKITKEQKPPFKIIVSISQKKHLFYKAVFNNDPRHFIANLEDEKINCDIDKLKEQFLFVSSMQSLGESKERMKSGEIRNDILLKTGYRAFKYLQEQLKTRQIQLPLFLSQKQNISEEEALCNLDSILNQ